MSMRLDTLDDRPELTVTIGGRSYQFSEMTVEKRADLQEYIRRTIPHPVDRIKPHLEGLTPEERARFLDDARAEARSWPPDVGSQAGMDALTSTEGGRVELLAVALSLHHPDATREDAARIYRELNRLTRREADEARRRGEPFRGGTARRIYMVSLGGGDPEAEDEIPEASGPDRAAGSIGACSTAPATNGSA